MTARSEYAARCATKASRLALADEVSALAARCGATVERNEPDGLQPKWQHVCLAYGPYRISMSFMGGLRSDAWLAHWHTESRSAAKYPPSFGYTVGGSVNTVHFAKATTCTTSWSRFLSCIEAGLLALSYRVVVAA